MKITYLVTRRTNLICFSEQVCSVWAALHWNITLYFHLSPAAPPPPSRASSPPSKSGRADIDHTPWLMAALSCLSCNFTLLTRFLFLLHVCHCYKTIFQHFTFKFSLYFHLHPLAVYNIFHKILVEEEAKEEVVPGAYWRVQGPAPGKWPGPLPAAPWRHQINQIERQDFQVSLAGTAASRTQIFMILFGTFFWVIFLLVHQDVYIFCAVWYVMFWFSHPTLNRKDIQLINLGERASSGIYFLC